METHLPKAILVFDRFHVVKLVGDKLAELRRQLSHQLPDADQRQALKGSRWLLLKDPGNLASNRDEAVDQLIEKRGGGGAQLMAMLLDFVPEAMAMGAMLASDEMDSSPSPDSASRVPGRNPLLGLRRSPCRR